MNPIVMTLITAAITGAISSLIAGAFATWRSSKIRKIRKKHQQETRRYINLMKDSLALTESLRTELERRIQNET